MLVTKGNYFSLVGTKYYFSQSDFERLTRRLIQNDELFEGFLIRDDRFGGLKLFSEPKITSFISQSSLPLYNLGSIGENYKLTETLDSNEIIEKFDIKHQTAYPIRFYFVSKEGTDSSYPFEQSIVKIGFIPLSTKEYTFTHKIIALASKQAEQSVLNRIISKTCMTPTKLSISTLLIKEEKEQVALQTRFELVNEKNSLVDLPPIENFLIGDKQLPLFVLDNQSGTVTTTTTTKIQNTKESKMKNLNSVFNKFGKDFSYPTSNFAMSMFGGLAVKTKSGNYVTFNQEKLEAIDTMDMVIDGFEDFIVIMPTQKLEDGDLFIKGGSVFAMIDSKSNEAYSFDEGTIVTLMDAKNAFGMNLYAKVFNVMGNMNTSNGSEGGVFGNPMMMMMLMMKDEDGGKGSNMMQMMMMSQMFSGGMKF